MKLLMCTEPGCLDVFRLFGGEPRRCRCGASSGRYLDEKRVLVEGPVVLLGVDNPTFEAAYKRWVEEDAGQVTLFFLPAQASTVERAERRRRDTAAHARRAVTTSRRQSTRRPAAPAARS